MRATPAAFLILALGFAAPTSPSPRIAKISAEDVRHFEKAHAALQERLDGLEKRVTEFTRLPKPEQALLTQDLLSFFNDNVLSHAEQETRLMYDQLDAAEPTKKLTVTASLRYENQVIRRNTQAFARDAKTPSPDPSLLQREADELLAIISMHLETEDRVILPAWKSIQTGEPA